MYPKYPVSEWRQRDEGSEHVNMRKGIFGWAAPLMCHQGRKCLNQPISVEIRSIWIGSQLLVGVLSSRGGREGAGLSHSRHTISTKFTVIKNTLDYHFLCVFSQSLCANNRFSKGLWIFFFFYLSKSWHQLFFKNVYLKFLKVQTIWSTTWVLVSVTAVSTLWRV